MFIRK